MTTDDIYYKGAIVNVTVAGGLGIVASDTVGQGHLSGVVIQRLDNTGKSDYADVEIGTIFIPFPTAQTSDVGDYVYAIEDDKVAKAASAASPIGLIEDVNIGVGFWINFDRGIPKTALA
jgi:hypothetical protein